MSLINQMLRDLEQRNQPLPATVQIRTVTSPRPQKSSFKRRWLWVLIAIPAYYWNQGQRLEISVVPVIANTENTTDYPAVISQLLHAEHEASSSSALAVSPLVLLAAVTREAQQTPYLNPPAPSANTRATKKTAPQPKSMKRAAARKSKTQHANTPARQPTRQAENLYRQALQSVSLTMQNDLLKQALQINPHYLAARSLLLQNLLKSSSTKANLQQFVDESLQLFPENLFFLKTRAHLFIQQKDFAAAIDVLEKMDSQRIDDTHYLSLLAVAYQQQQRFTEAAHIYQLLTAQQPDKAEHWLGLGITLEQCGQKTLAAQAFNQALEKNALNSEVVDYIKQRLSVLN
jgi:MSHA biogenesis protein MshN